MPTTETALPEPAVLRRIGRVRAVAARLEHAPQTLRALVRADELWLVLLAAMVGIAAGLAVVAMNEATQLAHVVLYGLQIGERLSARASIAPGRAFIPAAGGLLMGLSLLALARWRPRRAVDPIEANALYGGRMSLSDSVVLVGQTLISNGCGASVGLEAGFTQIGAAMASRVGRGFRLLMGLSLLALARWRPRRAVDPIEANALYGGRMSLSDSLVLVGQTLISNGCGASVGLEAGFTQIGAAMASRVGRGFRLRRGDMRVLVGAGAAAAIAAAFNAPLAGAFYAFELVIGTYTLATLAPVVAAAITAVTVQRILLGDIEGFAVPPMEVAETAAFLPLIALGVLAALAGIALMRGVTLTEEAFRRSTVPAWLRPAIGGLVVGALALVSPEVLSSGHGALKAGLTADLPLGLLLLSLALKSAASAISIGSGFRGGLFFASLLMGALLGKAFAAVMLLVSPMPMFPEVVYGLVGMSAFAVAVVGGPLTMAFLALESTGSLPLTVAVLAAAVVSSLTVRRTFGYSFATWRFHLRGENIRSAVDIGWMRSLTVGRMMRREVRTVPADMHLAMFCRENPLGSANRVVALDAADRYAGIVWLDDAYAAQESASRVADVLHHRDVVLLPDMNVKDAAAKFESAEADALAVVDGLDTLKVIGLLTEQYALRRYVEELDRRRRDLSGE